MLMDVEWYLIVVMISDFLMSSDAEHLFTYLLAACISSMDKCLFRSFARLKNLMVFYFFFGLSVVLL